MENPLKLIDIVIKGRTNITLSGELYGMHGGEIDNDKGAIRGSPLSAPI